MQVQAKDAVGAEAAAIFYYQSGKANRCPGCGGSQWLVGRVMAECAQCETALPLQASFRASRVKSGSPLPPFGPSEVEGIY
jgi:hypothetical protein